jgi:hypothetical protein
VVQCNIVANSRSTKLWRLALMGVRDVRACPLVLYTPGSCRASYFVSSDWMQVRRCKRAGCGKATGYGRIESCPAYVGGNIRRPAVTNQDSLTTW